MKSMPPRTTELESEPADCIAAQKILPLLLSDGLFFLFFFNSKKACGTNNDPQESDGNYLQ